jgi:hypothetical protein
MLRKILCAAILPTLIALSTGVQAGDTRIIFSNQSGNTVQHVHTKPAQAGRWSGDILNGVIRHGSNRSIDVNDDGGDVCRFDIRVINEHDQTALYESINACDTDWLNLDDNDFNN